MKYKRVLVGLILVLILGLGLSAWASAEVVGHITKVQGRVDLLKGGKLPATPVKLQDAVEPGDVLRAKSLSRAQITFIDNTIITLSSGSRLAIKAYEFDPVKKKRNAVLRIFQGLAHVVVSKVFKMEEPDFIFETHTAVLGVRGTDFGVRLQPNSSTILNFKGLVQVANIFPEVGQLSRRTSKVAYAFPPLGSHNSVLLKDMQGCTVAVNLPPTVPFTLTAEDRKQFMRQLVGGLSSQKKGEGPGEGSEVRSATGAGGSQVSSGAGTVETGGGVEYLTNLGGPDSGLGSMVSSSSSSASAVPAIVPLGLTSGTGSAGVTALNTVTIPPVNVPTVTPTAENTMPAEQNSTSAANATQPVIPPSPPSPPPPPTPPTPPTPPSPPPPPAPVTYNFTQTSYGYWQTNATSPTSYNLSYQGWAERTLGENSPQYYLVTSTGTRDALPGITFSSVNSLGTSFSTITGTVSGVPGETLTGTADIITTISGGYQIVSPNVPVSISPDGTLSVLTASSILTNASGTPIATAVGTSNSYTPGQYFQESTAFTTQDQPASPYYNVRRTVTISGGGSRTGVLPGDFNLSLFQTEFKEYNYSFNPSGSTDSQTATLQGVVAPDGQGGYTGVVSGSPSSAPSLLVAGPVSLQSSGQLNAMFLGVDDQTGTTRSLPAFWLQTPEAPLGTAQYTMPINGLSTSSPTTLATVVAADPSYTLSLVGYSGWQFLTDPSGGSANTQSYGWGYMTGVYSTFFISSGTSTRIPASGSTFNQAIATGEAYGTGTGTVSGTLGNELTGTMTYLGTNSYGIKYELNGAVTLLPTGEMTYAYAGVYTDAATGTQDGGTSSGTMTLLPGQYFQQVSTGTSTQTSNSATNDGPFKGTKFDLAVNNGAPQNFNAAFYVSVNNDSATPGSFQDTIYSQGVTTTKNGTTSGAMTTYAVDNATGQITRMSGPVVVDADGTTTAWLLGADGPDHIKGMWIQTTDPNAQLVIETGSFPVTSYADSSTTGTVNGSGSGTLYTTSSSGTVNSPSSITLNATATETGSGTFEPGTNSISLTLAGVVHADNSGPGHAIAYVPDNTLVFMDGTVYFDSYGRLIFDFTGNWTSPDSQGTLSGELIDPVIALDQAASGSLRQTYSHYIRGHHRHNRRMADAREAAMPRHLNLSSSTHHSSQALVSDYINHTSIANIAIEKGAFSPTLTTASITATVDEGVVPGDTDAPYRRARNNRTMTHNHRTARVDKQEGQMGSHGHFHGLHREPLDSHHRDVAPGETRAIHQQALSRRGPLDDHHRALSPKVSTGSNQRALSLTGPKAIHHKAPSHAEPMGIQHRAHSHRGPIDTHQRALHRTPMNRRNPVAKLPHHLPGGPKTDLAQKAH
jgi:hypothetical protein